MTTFDEIERLRKLRDASTKSATSGLSHNAMFYDAAHAALGPDGCVSKELTYLQETIETEVAVGARLADENEALKSEVERLRWLADDRDQSLTVQGEEIDALKSEVERLTRERDTYKMCHASVSSDNELRVAEAIQLKAENDRYWQHIQDGKAEVERQRWVFGELDRLKNELSELLSVAEEALVRIGGSTTSGRYNRLLDARMKLRAVVNKLTKGTTT